MRREDFWSNVNVGPDNECWNWLRARGSKGYGRLVIDGADFSAHRIAYELSNRNAKGFVVRHSCDNRLCCNPAHLKRGTKKQNTHDAMKRGRMSLPPITRGDAHSRSVITEDQARAIKSAPGANADIARRLGVSKRAVEGIKYSRTWRWL